MIVKLETDESEQEFDLRIETSQGVEIVGNGTNIYLKDKEFIILGGKVQDLLNDLIFIGAGLQQYYEGNIKIITKNIKTKEDTVMSLKVQRIV